MVNDTSYSSLWLYDWKPIDGLNDALAKTEGLSELNPALAGKIIRYWSEEEDIILDPFAGRGRAVVAMLHNRHYIGFEVSEMAYKQLYETISQERYEDLPQPVLHNEDSYNLDNHPLPEVDLIFTCPPYWNLEQYESVPGQLSNMDTYQLFLERLKQIMGKAVKKLKKDGFLVMVVGDWRDDGKLIPFHSDCIPLLSNLSLELWDIIVNQSVTWHLACKRFGKMRDIKKTSKVHEYILVFKKT